LLYNAAGSVVLWQVHVAYNLFFKMFVIFYFRCLSGQLPVDNGWWTSNFASTTVWETTCYL